jgi:hypothetical protein
MAITLNKNGKPRKVGSGKTKGAGCYAQISLREVRKLINDNEEISVSRVWLRSVQDKKKADSINFELKVPKVKPEYKPTSTPKIPVKPVSSTTHKQNINILETNDDDDYEPPPLFATDAGVRNY